MVRAFLPRAVLLLVLTLILAAPMQAAGPAGSPPAEPAAKSILTQVWDLLTGVWARSGCTIDPDGRCVPPPSPTIEIDSGCTIDPNGRCGH